MTTLTELTTRALNAMGDGGGDTWSSAQVEEWLREAIADYGQYFPRQRQVELPAPRRPPIPPRRAGHPAGQYPGRIPPNT